MKPVQLIAGYCKRNLLLVVAAVLLGFLEAVCNSLGTALIVPAVISFLGLVNPQSILPGASPASALAPISGFMSTQFLPALVLSLFLLRIIISPMTTAIRADLGRRLDVELRVSMLGDFLDTDLSLIRAMSPGDVLHRLGYSVTSSVASFEKAFDLTRLGFSAAILSGILLYCSWQLTLIVAVLLVVLIVAVRISSNRSHELGKYKTRVIRMAGVYATDLVYGIRTIKERGSEKFELRRLVRIFGVSEKLHGLSATHILVAESLCEFVAIAILFTSLIALRWTVLLVYLPVLLRLMTTLNRLGSIVMSLTQSYPELGAICDFFNQTSKKQLVGGTRVFESLKDSIELRNVSFTHSQLKTPLFTGLSLRIPRGVTVAIVGISGVGKTTLCDLLLRFYDPDAGSILLDGVDLKEFDTASLRKRIAIISQDNYLFSRSIKSNIVLGAHGVSSELFEQSIHTAGLDPVVEKLPHGVNTLMGARGSALSLGERQRIAIARALIIQPEILILDEATGAVDPLVDRQIHNALKEIGPNCTRIVVSHRPSTIRQAQVIVLLSEGRIQEQGTHEELIALNGEYARLYGGSA